MKKDLIYLFRVNIPMFIILTIMYSWMGAEGWLAAVGAFGTLVFFDIMMWIVRPAFPKKSERK
jgi:hypothetical protein